MNVGARSPNVLAPPLWAKDFGGREHILPFPGRLNPVEFEDAGAVRVKVNSPGGVSGGVDEIQTVTLNATGGSFRGIFKGQTTGLVAWNATAATFKAALEALSTVGAGNVNVWGANGGPYSVQFTNALGRSDQPAMTTDATALTGGAGTAVVATAQAGAAGATTVPVDALPGDIPAGVTLNFGTGNGNAKTSAAVAAGATSIPVEALTAGIADDAVALYSAFGRKYVPSGELVGRTTAERNSNADWGRATDTDDEVYFVMFDVTDANNNPDCEFYRHGGMVAENYLPQSTRDLLTANAALRAKLAGLYVLMNGTD